MSTNTVKKGMKRHKELGLIEMGRFVLGHETRIVVLSCDTFVSQRC